MTLSTAWSRPGHSPFTAGVTLYEKHGVPIRLFDYDGMVHDLPASEEFHKQLRWVNPTGREAAQQRETQAAAALALSLKRPIAPSGPQRVRKALRLPELCPSQPRQLVRLVRHRAASRGIPWHPVARSCEVGLTPRQHGRYEGP